MPEHDAHNARSIEHARASSTLPESRVEPEPFDFYEDCPEAEWPPQRDSNLVTKGEVVRSFNEAYVQKRASLVRPVTEYGRFSMYRVAFEKVTKKINKHPKPREALERALKNFFNPRRKKDLEFLVDADFPGSVFESQWNTWVDPPPAREEEKPKPKRYGMLPVGNFDHLQPMPPPDKEERERLRRWGCNIPEPDEAEPEQEQVA